MTKTKTINSLSYSLAHSYFSTMNYYSKGYMSDWIVNGALQIGHNKVKIDILKKTIHPQELMIRPLIVNLDYLEGIIQKTLESNDLPPNFITEANFDIDVTTDRKIIVSHYTKGINNRIYSSKPYVEQSYEKFKVLNITRLDLLIEKIKNIRGRFRFFLLRKFKIGELKYTESINTQNHFE